MIVYFAWNFSGHGILIHCKGSCQKREESMDFFVGGGSVFLCEKCLIISHFYPIFRFFFWEGGEFGCADTRSLSVEVLMGVE